MGRGQGVPTFKESACCSDQPVQGAAWDTGGSHDCSSDKPEGASPGPMKLKAWRPDVEPACLGRGAGVPHAKPLVQTRCVCRMPGSPGWGRRDSGTSLCPSRAGPWQGVQQSSAHVCLSPALQLAQRRLCPAGPGMPSALSTYLNVWLIGWLDE